MAAVINDRDVLLLGSDERTTSSEDSNIILQPSATGFSVNSDGVASPATIRISAALINLTGTVTFTATGATVVDNHDNTATIAYSTYTGQSATVTATLSGKSQSITIGAVATGGQGSQGPAGMQYKDVSLYQWATALPNKPTGNTSWSWVNNVNAAYSASDGWSTIDNLPNNPGGNFKLYVATVTISAPGGTASTIVSYAMAVLQSLVANGANGISGTQAAEVVVYRWDTSIPTGPVGTVTLTWADRSFVAPNGWERMPSDPPSQGLTRYAARIQIIDSATATTTTRNWTGAAIYVDGSAGNNGAAGPQGASATIAYAASSSFGDTFAPTPTTGKNSVPATNDGGIVGTYSLTVPTVPVGQRMYQTDGIYDPLTNKVVWSAPYWSVFKVGSLSAITAIMGRLTITDTIADANGNWSIDGNGHMIARSADFIDPNTGQTVLSLGGKLNPNFAAPGTLNSDLGPSISAAAKTAQYDLVDGRPQSVSNIVKKFSFEDNLIGGWKNAQGVEQLFGVGSGEVPYTKQLVCHRRDTLEIDNYFSVTPGETLYFGAWLNTEATTLQSAFGVIFYDINGNFVGSRATPAQNPNQKWQYVQGSGLIPDYAAVAVPWLWENGNDATDFVNGNWLRATGMWIGRHQLGATVGAPSGTYVGGTEAGLVASRALNGDSAFNALPGVNSAINSRLRKDAADTLSGQIGLQSQYALLVGDANNGVWMGSGGIFMVQGGVVKASLPISGNPTFAGQLLAAFGSFGALRVASGGYIASGNFDGSWNWPNASGVVGWVIRDEGILFGDKIGGKWFQLTREGNVYGPGFKIENGQLTIENPIIINPDLRIPALNISVSTPTGTTSSMSRNVKGGATQSAYVSVSGGSGNYTISFDATGDTNCRPSILSGTQSSILVDGPGIANPDGLGYTLKITVVDNNTGKQGVAFVNYAVTFS